MTTEVLVAAAEAVHAEYQKPSLAFRLGHDACVLGILRGRNPFRVDCVYEWTEWRSGWDAAFSGKSTEPMLSAASSTQLSASPDRSDVYIGAFRE